MTRQPITEFEKSIAAVTAREKLEAPSEGAAPEQGETTVVAAVATGSLPVSSADISALAAEWDEKAAHNVREHTYWKTRSRTTAETFMGKAAVYERCARELRRLAGLPPPRQPEENMEMRDAPKSVGKISL